MRPRLPETERRAAILKVRVRRDEKALVEKAARRSRLSVSDFIRVAVFLAIETQGARRAPR